ncbi:hypothetical protein D3C84_751670 [compost metagenome]
MRLGRRSDQAHADVVTLLAFEASQAVPDWDLFRDRTVNGGNQQTFGFRSSTEGRFTFCGFANRFPTPLGAVAGGGFACRDLGALSIELQATVGVPLVERNHVFDDIESQAERCLCSTRRGQTNEDRFTGSFEVAADELRLVGEERRQRICHTRTEQQTQTRVIHVATVTVLTPRCERLEQRKTNRKILDRKGQARYRLVLYAPELSPWHGTQTTYRHVVLPGASSAQNFEEWYGQRTSAETPK